MKKIHVIDQSERGYIYPRSENPAAPIKCTGLAKLARKECANWGLICKNCRLCNHRQTRCAYFERAVLSGLSIKDAERYATALNVALEKRGKKHRRIASWDRLESRTADDFYPNTV